MTVVELLKSVMIDAHIERSSPNITESLLKTLQDEPAKAALLDTAIQVIDEYLNSESSDSIFQNRPTCLSMAEI